MPHGTMRPPQVVISIRSNPPPFAADMPSVSSVTPPTVSSSATVGAPPGATRASATLPLPTSPTAFSPNHTASRSNTSFQFAQLSFSRNKESLFSNDTKQNSRRDTARVFYFAQFDILE